MFWKLHPSTTDALCFRTLFWRWLFDVWRFGSYSKVGRFCHRTQFFHFAGGPVQGTLGHFAGMYSNGFGSRSLLVSGLANAFGPLGQSTRILHGLELGLPLLAWRNRCLEIGNPFRDTWLTINTVRRYWAHAPVTKAHLTEVHVAYSPVMMWERERIIFADISAKAVASLNSTSPLIASRHDKAARLSYEVCRYFMLEWAIDRSLPPFTQAVGNMRTLKLPEHAVAMGPGGIMRCTRCLMGQSEIVRLQGMTCVAFAVRPHFVMSCGTGIVRGRGGLTLSPRRLHGSGCRGKPASAEVSRRLQRCFRASNLLPEWHFKCRRLTSLEDLCRHML